MNGKLMVALLTGSLVASAAPIDEYLDTLSRQAKAQDPSFAGFDAKRGEKIFTQKHIGKRGKRISCVSCHGTARLDTEGENIFTGKKIAPLAPSVNPQRLTDIKKVKKWLRRNFKDVYRREGTAQEKGDVLRYIMSR